jgi:hypothetical protein
MITTAATDMKQTDRTASWREAQVNVLSFMRKHPRQWWAIDRLSKSINLPQGYVTMLLVELWVDGRVSREWAGDQPIFQLHKEL